MKLKLIIATAAATLAVAGAGSAMAQTNIYDLSVGTPTLVGGDEAYVNVTAPNTPNLGTSTFSYTYTFNLGAVGPSNDLTETVNLEPVSKLQKNKNLPSVSNVVATFYKLGSTTPVGSVSGDSGSITLAAGTDYSVKLSAQDTLPSYRGQYTFDLQTSVAPVPGPAGFLVAIGGMGALLLKRRRASRDLAA
jgi:MYXO-CTERM domain-containing protein